MTAKCLVLWKKKIIYAVKNFFFITCECPQLVMALDSSKQYSVRTGVFTNLCHIAATAYFPVG